MTDFSHLNALYVRLSHERTRLATAKSTGEIAFRTVCVAGIEKEIAVEKLFLGITDAPAVLDMSDDELLAALGIQ